MAQLFLPGVGWGGSHSDYNASLSSNWTELDWTGTELGNFSECGIRQWDCDWKDVQATYYGTQNTTKFGHTCIPWNKVKRRANPYPHATHNYCRCGKGPFCHNPWCYVDTKGENTDYCEIRRCSECDSGEFRLRQQVGPMTDLNSNIKYISIFVALETNLNLEYNMQTFLL